MSINVTFAGSPYVVPEVGDAYGTSLTNFLVAVAQKASVSTKFVQSVRVTTANPYTLVSDDTFVVDTTLSPTVNLLAGELGRVVGIFASNTSEVNTLTINANGGQTINGASSLTIIGPNCGAMLQFTGIEWQIIDLIKPALPYRFATRDSTNNSVYNANTILSPSYTAPTVTDGQATTITYDAGVIPKFAVTGGSSGSVEVYVDGTHISAIFDPSNLFLNADSGTGIYFSVPGAGQLSVKNRTGVSQTFKIAVKDGRATSATAWS